MASPTSSKTFFGSSTKCRTRQLVSRDTARRPTDLRAARQTGDTRTGQSFSSVDCYEKKRPDEPFYEPRSSPQVCVAISP